MMIARLNCIQRFSGTVLSKDLHIEKMSNLATYLHITKRGMIVNYAEVFPFSFSRHCKTDCSHKAQKILCYKGYFLKKPSMLVRIARELCVTKMMQSSKNTEDDFCDTGQIEEIEGDREYENLVKRMFHLPEMGHQVLVIQPYIKWGKEKKKTTTPDLQLEEAVALIKTLSSWKVVDSMKIPLQSMGKRTVFGSGNLAKLKEKILRNKHITAVFISIDILRGYQRRELEDIFGVPVYDRYMIVIQIFREHAVSREAKLQVSVAEIPYLRIRLKAQNEGSVDHHGGLLNAREQKLKNMLDKLKNHRKLLRKGRQKSNFPIVAVVGYTNAGKTSLIKALTGDSNLEPKDYLFATLDVTAHAGFLPCRLKVLYMDTVGFISDLPSRLIESFVATLEDALLADVIIHVCDISHPDIVAQTETVTNTLKGLNLNSQILENIIVVGNKVDLVSDETLRQYQNDMLLVSAVKQQGVDNLQKILEAAIMKVTDRVNMVIRVPAGSEESRWLHKQAAVTEIRADDEDPQLQLMNVVISKAELNKFKHKFIRNT